MIFQKVSQGPHALRQVLRAWGQQVKLEVFSGAPVFQEGYDLAVAQGLLEVEHESHSRILLAFLIEWVRGCRADG